LNGLGNALVSRFDRFNNLDDLNEAILIYKGAVSLLTDEDFRKALWLSNLGIAKKKLFLESGHLSDLNDGVDSLTDAVRLCPDGHARKASLFFNLATAMYTRFFRLGDENDYAQAIASYTSAACSQNAPASVRFQTAVWWAQLPQFNKFKGSIGGPAMKWNELKELMKLGPDSVEVDRVISSRLESWFNPEQKLGIPSEEWSESIPAYTVALGILPELSWLGSSIRDRHHQMAAVGKVVRDAVGTAINAHQYNKAVEWLEQGRSVIWGQILELRTPVDALKQTHLELAEKFLLLSAQLEDAGTRGHSLQREPLDSGGQYHGVAHARNLLLKEIRALPHFNRFLLPKTMSALFSAAERGPVVILSTSSWGTCDALVLMPGLDSEVLRIDLPAFTMQYAETLEETLRRLLREGGRGMKREGKMAPEAEFADILAELWERIAKPVLVGIGYNVS
jgi:hypothetical protein